MKKYLSGRYRLQVFCLLFSSLSLVLVACGEDSNKVFTVGINLSSKQVAAKLDGLKAGLKTLGYTEGKNIRFQDLATEGLTDEQVSAGLKDFAAKNFDAYWVTSEGTAGDLKKLGLTKPIIVAGLSASESKDLVESASRPGGNVTGVDDLNADLAVKRLNLFTKIVPEAKNYYVIYNPKSPGYFESMQVEAKKLGITLIGKPVANATESKKVVPQFNTTEGNAIIATSGSPFRAASADLKPLLEKEKLPLAGIERNNLDLGALFIYGISYTAIGKQTAVQLDKILHGTSPAVIPVEPGNKIDLFLNQKMADQLGIKFPDEILKAADEVIK